MKLKDFLLMTSWFLLFHLGLFTTSAFAQGNEALVESQQQAEAGNPQAAIDTATQAIETDPESAEAYVARGYAYVANRDKVSAIADFEKAIELFNFQGKTDDAQKIQSLLNLLQGEYVGE